MVGKSTCGSGATGSSGNATMPISASAAISSEVAIGRRMKGSEMFMRAYAGVVGRLVSVVASRRACPPAAGIGR